MTLVRHVCQHCYAESGPTGAHGVMNGDDWQRMINESAALGARMVQFIRGEPTLHPELSRLVDQALRLHVEVEVFTDLVQVTPQLWDTLRPVKKRLPADLPAGVPLRSQTMLALLLRGRQVTSDDDGQREWMREQLQVASAHFSVTSHGEPVFGWHDRTIGSRVSGPDGERWLRVSWADPHWAQGEYWTGNEDSTIITGVPKPVVLDRYEWGEKNYSNRAEIMTLVTDQPCSPTQELRDDIDLPDQWWSDLRSALDTLAQQPTDRGKCNQQQVSWRLLAFFGSGIDPTVTEWVTAHGDLNWTNLTRPSPVLLDWESWGRKMVGYDAATLAVLSLRAPDTAKKVHDTFADIVDSPDGIRAQLSVIARYLKRVELGDFGDYADHLHRHARTLLDRT